MKILTESEYETAIILYLDEVIEDDTMVDYYNLDDSEFWDLHNAIVDYRQNNPNRKRPDLIDDFINENRI